mmetsp:Transcript_26406/g.60840  ORF Transcript_26406/g.60840 Transcript_26406/m.60840 type:complete len:95 (+) Transcript_26406:142-426(+)
MQYAIMVAGHVFMLFLCISNTSYISALDNDEIPTIKRLLEVPEIEEKGPEFVIGKKKRCKPRGEGDATSSKNVTKRKCEKSAGRTRSVPRSNIS